MSYVKWIDRRRSRIFDEISGGRGRGVDDETRGPDCERVTRVCTRPNSRDDCSGSGSGAVLGRLTGTATTATTAAVVRMQRIHNIIYLYCIR